MCWSSPESMPLDEALADGIHFHDLEDFSLVICKPDRRVIYSGVSGARLERRHAGRRWWKKVTVMAGRRIGNSIIESLIGCSNSDRLPRRRCRAGPTAAAGGPGVLEARREATALARGGQRPGAVLQRLPGGPGGGSPGASGVWVREEVLHRLTVGRVETLARRWMAFYQERGLGTGLERIVDQLKKLEHMPRQRSGGMCSNVLGALPTEERAKAMRRRTTCGARSTFCWTRGSGPSAVPQLPGGGGEGGARCAAGRQERWSGRRSTFDWARFPGH